MGRFAIVPQMESLIGLESLGLNPEKSYVAFDFWRQKFLGIVSVKIKCRALELGHCQIISLCEIENYPQFIASSRHVSMDNTSVMDQIWNEGILSIKLKGVLGTKENYWFYMPKSYDLCNVYGTGLKINCELQQHIAKVNVEFINESGVLKLCFN